MLKINKISSSPVIDFAAEELKKYLRMMMPDCGSIPIAYAPEARDGFVLGLMQELSLDTSDAKDTVLDDIVYLDTAEDGGIIAGDNPRAVLNRKRGKDQQAFEILNIPGYNIGTFALPFTQSFLGPIGVLTTSLFDVGNAFVCLGGAYGVASAVKDGKGLDLKRVGKALAVSVPFLAHIITVCMNLFHIPIPAFVADCAKIIASANVFLAMLMIGVGFKTDMDFSQKGTIARILIVRYSVATALALGFYFLLPFDLPIRQTLVILAFAPIGSAVPGFTAELKGDVGLSCTVNSLAILISIPIIVALLAVML